VGAGGQAQQRALRFLVGLAPLVMLGGEMALGQVERPRVVRPPARDREDAAAEVGLQHRPRHRADPGRDAA